VAAGIVPLELGTDMAGSLRVPAHCCGVFAHKPTHGLVPMRGIAPPGVQALPTGRGVDFAVVGPLARSAADLSLALDVLAGPDVLQATAYRLALPPPRHDRLRDFRVLLLDEHPIAPTSHEVRAALLRFAEALARSGCTLASTSPLLPDLRQVASTFTTLLMSFVGADLPEAEYRQIQLAAARLAPDDRGTDALEQRGLVLSHRDWIHADRLRAVIASQWQALFREFDLVVCPVWSTPAFKHDHREMSRRRARVDGVEVGYSEQSSWITLASIAGLPATALPIGLGESGLPIGVQAIGPVLEDRTPLHFAELAERDAGGFIAPPPVPR
jgi:amidase